MKVKQLPYLIPSLLTQKLSKFEKEFTYPLGQDQSFRIDHGEDYGAFYRSIGDECIFYLEKENRVIGVISTTIKSIKLASGKVTSVGYIGDIKLTPSYQKTIAALYLFKSIKPFLEQQAQIAYGLVMDGTKTLPSQYTGKASIPNFTPISKQYILRFNTNCTITCQSSEITESTQAWKIYTNFLSKTPHDNEISQYQYRSSIEPQWMTIENTAIGMLENTRKSKRLYLVENDEEIKSTHLSYFAFNSKASAKNLIINALKKSKELGFPGMFISFNEKNYKRLQPYLEDMDFTLSTATVYATDEKLKNYNINSSEI